MVKSLNLSSILKKIPNFSCKILLSKTTKGGRAVNTASSGSLVVKAIQSIISTSSTGNARQTVRSVCVHN